MSGQSMNYVAGGDRPISTAPHIYGPPKPKPTGLNWDSIRVVPEPEPVDDKQTCEKCLDAVHTLSSRSWCDGCEEEAERPIPAPVLVPEPEPEPVVVEAEIIDDPEPVTFTSDIMAIACTLRETGGSEDPLVQVCREAVISAANVLRAVALAEIRTTKQKPRRTSTPRKPRTESTRVRRNDIDVPQFIRRYEAGETINQISADLGNSTHTFRRKLQAAGVTMRDDRATHTGGANALELKRPELIGQIRDLYTYERLSQALVSKRLGISVNAVTRIMKRNGIQAREGQAGGGDTLTGYRARLDRLGVTSHQVRDWATANGYQVHPRGAIPREMLDAFETAHQ